MRSALLVERSLLDDGATALRARMHLVGVPVIAVDPPFSPRALRAALGTADTGWLVCGDAAAVVNAATAALIGVVLIGVDPPAGDQGLVVARALNLVDAPRVMVPQGGGCWHDHRSA